MKSYENNMADQDIIVHSLRVLSEIKNPALSQLKRDLNTQQASAQALALKQEKFYQSLSDDGIINPMEKKIVQREMESISTSYTALYTQAVAEHYDQAPFFQDYMATYAALRDYIYSTLHLFDNMEADTEVNRDEFNQYFSNYYYSENFALVSMTVGVITDLGFKILDSLEDEGEEGEVGIYRGMLYQYIDGEWMIINRELYYGKSDTIPPALEGRYFLCTDNVLLYDVLYVNDDPLELNDELFEVGGTYEKGIIYVYQDHHWQRVEPDEDYRYIVALGDYYSVKEELPLIFKSEVENIARIAAGSTYYGPLSVPPQNPQENDFFLYSGETSGETPPRWVFASLYMYKNNEWVRLDEAIAQNQKYYMEALQDILTITEATSGYFSTVFCNAFFANQAAMNALSVQVIYLKSPTGTIRSEDYEEGEEGLLIDANGNIDANENTHIGGSCTIDGDAIILGNTTIGSKAIFRGEIESGPLILKNTAPSPIITTYNAGTIFYAYPTSQQKNINILDGIHNVDGAYGPYLFDAIEAGYNGSPGYGIITLALYKNQEQVYKVTRMSTQLELQYELLYSERISPSDKTFKLIDIPRGIPAESDIVYVDENGFLKLS